jgi:MFS family permease
MVTVTSAEVMFEPAHQTAIAELAGPQRRGRTFGLVGQVQLLGIAFAPLVGGLLLDAIGTHHAAMWGTIALLGMGQTWCFARYVRLRNRFVGTSHFAETQR